MNTIIDTLNWRYATKKFDNTKKVSDEDLNTLLEAARLSPSSYGLQPYHVFVITDMEIRKKLQPVSWNQTQVVDASHLLVFANKAEFGSELVDDYLQNVSSTRGMDMENLKGYGDFMKSKLLDLPVESKDVWTAKQVYIALGNVMTAAATLEIDTCPMEGFEADPYDEILGLKDKSLRTAVVLPIGYRSEEDQTQHFAKVRYSKEELFTHI
ncbi:NAD(P)H-dependent oxidoreductase [Flagellimonas allohymeniacidonis]|uniref:NAD(P)H-dependent oxidoreductase n=1 Tax=Flagellimonas allohymeniacidonis TaxID=2517819 RepID=A0A4Q8QAP8_9FLAO|nr:NAD(P)H-dependent oxidoreductase [Allomuricauda hymeniacidonis]TAI46724.1 NAD(P)H-dependent oxidoreductase [Allomuricauda hymeniacidonis]